MTPDPAVRKCHHLDKYADINGCGTCAHERMEAAREQAAWDARISADKAASPFFNAGTYREDYRYD